MFTEANATIMVSDMDRSWRFYTDVLGLEPGERWEDHYAIVHAPGVTIGLHPGGKPGVHGEGFTLSLGTPDLDATVAALRERGVDFDGPISSDGPRRAVNCRDPDGHVVHLREAWGGG